VRRRNRGVLLGLHIARKAQVKSCPAEEVAAQRTFPIGRGPHALERVTKCAAGAQAMIARVSVCTTRGIAELIKG